MKNVDKEEEMDFGFLLDDVDEIVLGLCCQNFFYGSESFVELSVLI